MNINKNRYPKANMKKGILLCSTFVFLLFMFSLVSAEEISKQYTDVDLKIPFEVNGSAASSSATCNVTVTYPNNTAVFTESPATNNDNGIFNITIISSQSNELGEYDWVAFCCDSNKCAAGYGSFEVTSTGNSKGFTIFLVLIISAVITFLLYYITEFDFLVFFSGIFFILGGIYSMIYGIESFTNLYSRGIAGILLGIGLIFIVASIYNLSKGEDYGEYN